MLARWQGNTFVICCEDKPDRFTNCGRDAWVEVIRKHCKGGAKAVSGLTQSKPQGLHIESQEPMYSGDSHSVDVTAVDSKNQCVEYECSTNVVP